MTELHRSILVVGFTLAATASTSVEANPGPSNLGTVEEIAVAQDTELPVCDSNEFIDLVSDFRRAHAAAIEKYRPGSEDYDRYLDSARVTRFDRLFVTATDLHHNNMHDCQRLILADRTGWRYGPLVAVFVDAQAVPQQAMTGVVAELYNFTPPEAYPILEIGGSRNIYCVWMSWQAAGPPEAWLLKPTPVPNRPDCEFESPNPSRGDMQLRVVRREATNNGAEFHRRARRQRRDSRLDVYPSTGRWLWADAGAGGSGGEQYIGIRCGDAWCELSPNGAVLQNAGFVDPDSIPGWYDEQYLARPDRRLSWWDRLFRRTYQLVPSALYGRIEPGPASRRKLQKGEHGLAATMTMSGDDPVARAHYKGKFDIHAAPVPGTSVSIDEIFTRNEDDRLLAWTFAVGYAGASTMTQRGVPHSGIGTVRWRWDERDEKGWVPCIDGCCTYKDDEA